MHGQHAVGINTLPQWAEKVSLHWRNTQLGTDVEDQPMAEKLWQRKLHFKKHIKELYLPPPPRKRMKDMNKQDTEKKKEMGYSRKQENNVIF